MDKLKESFNKVWVKFKSFNKIIKISIIVMLITIIIALGSLFFYKSSTKYQVLFSNLELSDAQIVMNKLTEEKVDMKIQGNTILVPKSEVDRLRLEIAPELSEGSQGYELMDSGNSFGMTDEEFQIKKTRMIQGELEKTIKSFPQIDTARVHITAAKDSVFVEDSEPGKAAVYIKLLPGKSLSKGQVKSIISLVSGSTENIPKENIEVIDDNMNLLSEGVMAEYDDIVSSESINKQYELKKKYEEDIQKSIVTLLEPVVGKGKVKSSVNVDLDFDSVQKTENIIDPNKVIVSQQVSKENNNDGSENTSNSPVDNNMETTIGDKTGTLTSSKEEVSTNYDSSKTEIKTIKAPGEVKRLTASVFIDGNIEGNVQQAIETSVANSIGLNAERGDSVSVVGMTFDPETKKQAEAEFEAISSELAKEELNRKILYGVLGLLVLGGIIAGIVLFFRKKSKSNKGEEEEESLLDIIIDDKLEEKEPMPSIDFDVVNPKEHIENEIKKYATEKPEQVADIIKAWLTENER